MNFRDYEKYTLNEEHRRMSQLMGATPQPLNERKDKIKVTQRGKDGGKIVVKDGKGDKDYKLVVTRGFQFDKDNLNAKDTVFKTIQQHKPINDAFPGLTPEQLLFSERKDGRFRDVFTFMIVDKQLPPEEKEELKQKVEELVVQVDVEKEEEKVEKEDGDTQPDP